MLALILMKYVTNALLMVIMSKYYPTKKFIKNKSIWAVYKGEECLVIGNFDEIEKKLNITRETIYTYVAKSYKKKRPGINCIQFVLVEAVKGKPIDYRKEYKKRKWENEKQRRTERNS